MFGNYFKIAIRNLIKHKFHSAINILGLAVGIASSIIIFLYAQNELTYNTNHEKADNIYQIYKERNLPAGVQVVRDTWFPMAQALKDEYPVIKKAAHIWDADEWIEVGEKRILLNVSYVNEDIFDVFTLPLKVGDKDEVFSDINSAVITDDIAARLFGNENPLGKTVRVDFNTAYTITGILEDPPQNTGIAPTFMVRSESISNYERQLTNWGSSYLYTYLLLEEGSNPANLEEQFPGFVVKTWDEELSETMKLKLTPLLQLYDDETNANQQAYILIGIAVGILLIASFNFMNLTTSRSIERAKEVGMRKVLGAQRLQLVKQFINESLVMAFVAMIAGIFITELLLPQFNELFGMRLELNYLENLRTLGGLLLLGAAVGFFSGSYPAIFLSKLRPVQSLKGENKTTYRGFNLRHVLVVAQFTISIVLIIGTVVMWQQVNHLRNLNMNLDKDQLLVMNVTVQNFEDREAAVNKIEAFKNELKNYSGIKKVSAASHTPGNWANWNTFVYPADRPESDRLRMRLAVIDENYFDIHGIEFIEGRNFNDEMPTDRDALILNEAAMRDIGWTTIDGKAMRGREADAPVIGVVKDYNFESAANEVGPLIHYFRSGVSGAHDYVTVKLAGSQIPQTISFIEDKWKEMAPYQEFTYNFMDENFARLYANEERVASVVSYFAVVGIIIACLGLFALVSLMVINRQKEIGVRRVLGASAGNVVYILSKDFMLLVLVSMLIAFPLAYYLMQSWLQDFASRVDIDPVTFVVSGLAAFAIALVTVSVQGIKAAMSNPVDSLRYE